MTETSTTRYERAVEALRGRVGDRTFAHSLRVAETAAGIAAAYGLDPEPARMAGLLHDWAKDESGERLLADAARLGLDMEPTDIRVPQLLHARVGAAQLAASMPDLPAEVIAAVEQHTLGCERMSDLARIVYIADGIEPLRRYEGVEQLRVSVGEVPLPELFVRSLASGIAYVVATRRELHPATLRVWNSVVADIDPAASRGPVTGIVDTERGLRA